MKQFLLLFMSSVSPEEMMQNANPDSMKPWMKWFEEHQQNVVEQGAPTGNEMNVTKTGSSKPNTYIGGYTVVQAEDANAARAMLSDHPHFMMEGNSIEVLEVLPTPGMLGMRRFHPESCVYQTLLFMHRSGAPQLS